MQVNRPSAPMPYQTQLDAPYDAKAFDTTAASSAPKAALKHHITSRTEDYLLRLGTHGTPLQKTMANGAYTALRNDTFIANTVRDKPVSQFGKSMILNERKGILLANFMPHDEQLELVALGFRAQLFFDSEAGSTDHVVLEYARELPAVETAQRLADLPSTQDQAELQRQNADPEAQPHEANSDESAHNAESGSAQPSKADLVAVRKEMAEHQRRYDRKPMFLHMANLLTKKRIENGSSGSRWTAVPAAHAKLALAKVKQAITPRDALPPLQYQATAEWAVTNPLPATPPGQEYQFGNHEFASFYYSQQDRANAPADTKRNVAPGSRFPERRHAMFISATLAQQLGNQLGAYGLRNSQSGEELERNRQALQSNNKEPGTSSTPRAGSGASISSSQLRALREALAPELRETLDANTYSDDSDTAS